MHRSVLAVFAALATSVAAAPAPVAAPASGSGFTGLGYDGLLKQVTLRWGLGGKNLDLGMGLQQDSDADPSFQFSASCFYLVPWKSYEKLSLDFTGGLVFATKDSEDGDATFGAFIGFTPRAVIFDHLEVATRFGLDIPLAPDAKFRSAGQGVSIVEGLSFKVLF
jgi:hypothetical protein